jgi:paraquat-inducible protein B
MMNFKNRLITALSGWYFWIFPFFAILITLFLIKEHYEKRGPQIKILFEDATGIQPERTRVRFRGVVVGIVDSVTISEDQKDVVAHVTLNHEGKNFASVGAKFALIVPKVNFKEVSGLETLVEGSYIVAQPGPNPTLFLNEFKGQIGKDIAESIEDTSSYQLQTENAGSISVGDSVTFRGIKIGSVSKVSLSKNAQSVLVQINIQYRFTKLIRANTHFWKKLAVQAKLGFLKAEIKINSLESFLSGGLELSTPNKAGEIAKPGTTFYLYPTPPKDSELWNPPIEF